MLHNDHYLMGEIWSIICTSASVSSAGVSLCLLPSVRILFSGLGLADVENHVPCHPYTVMRIASISKSMTMAVVARLWEEGKLDLDKPVQHYVPSFPKKTFNQQEVLQLCGGHAVA
jgi:CubicO group peptidase (beta-lactamase class C family)